MAEKPIARSFVAVKRGAVAEPGDGAPGRELAPGCYHAIMHTVALISQKGGRAHGHTEAHTDGPTNRPRSRRRRPTSSRKGSRTRTRPGIEAPRMSLQGS